MDFFLEIHNGECGLGGLFCDHQMDQETVLTQAEVRQKSGRGQNPGRGNEQGECTLLITTYVSQDISKTCYFFFFQYSASNKYRLTACLQILSKVFAMGRQVKNHAVRMNSR